MILLTAPTGLIGAQVLDRLRRTPHDLRVVVRDPDRLPADVHDRVEVVVGSHADPTDVARALDGVEQVFWLVPPDPTAASLDAAYTGFSRALLDALPTSGVHRVVGVSALGRGTAVADQAGHVTATLALDDAIGATGVAYRALANPSFMDNVARQTGSLRDRGVWSSPLEPTLALPTCATRDIAATAVRLLTDDTWGGVADVPVLGPEDLSPDDMSTVMGEVLGRPVRYEQVTLETAGDQARARGTSPAMVQAWLDMFAAKARGLDQGVTRTPDTSSPTTFRTWCEDVLLPTIGGRAEGPTPPQ